jgi:hypothetical protein
MGEKTQKTREHSKQNENSTLERGPKEKDLKSNEMSIGMRSGEEKFGRSLKNVEKGCALRIARKEKRLKTLAVIHKLLITRGKIVEVF